jgi:hypothetical protein
MLDLIKIQLPAYSLLRDKESLLKNQNEVMIKPTKTKHEVFERGMLDDDFVLDCITNQRRTLLNHCLGITSDIPDSKGKEIMSSQNGKSITDLSWKAALKPRTGIEIQKNAAGVTSLKLVNAKDGIEYPFN